MRATEREVSVPTLAEYTECIITVKAAKDLLIVEVRQKKSGRINF